MPARSTEASRVAALATLLTLVLALPVLRAPSERIFGAEIVGRHHDPFTVMQQFTRPVRVETSSQPLTDVPGALLTRLISPVAAYNWLVLVSFPLTAVTTFLLARHLAISPAGATLAALASAFSPFHLAHAAYHPHIAQVQWLPLYLLALWRCLDQPTARTLAALIAASAAVILSNLYGGFAAAVISPFAVLGYWVVTRHGASHPWRRLAATVGALALIAAAGVVYMSWSLPAAVAEGATAVVSRRDLFLYSAKWWSYLVPPVEHPLLGPAVSRLWTSAGVGVGLLEQQVSLGWGIISLALVAIAASATRRPGPASLTGVAVLTVVAVAALVCSLSPERTIGSITLLRPSAWLYEVMPMFRSYARFGVIVQLMAALLAGIGVDTLLRSRHWRGRLACAALVTLVVAEYTVWPSSMWRDVLPTTAHRWVMQQPWPIRVLDCQPRSQETDSVQWLTAGRVIGPSGDLSDCGEPGFATKLAAHDYTHLLLRGDSPEAPWIARAADRDHFTTTARFTDAQVYGVAGPKPALYTGVTMGFSPREHDADWSWRWMGAEATWVVTNTTGLATIATLDLELAAFAHDRSIRISLNGDPVEELLVDTTRRSYRIGPFTIQPGAHELQFAAPQAPSVANDVIRNGDHRPLSIAVGTWAWGAQDGRR